MKQNVQRFVLAPLAIVLALGLLAGQVTKIPRGGAADQSLNTTDSPTFANVTATTSLKAGTAPFASAGDIRLPSGGTIQGRNSANNANVRALRVDTDNSIDVGDGTSGVSLIGSQVSVEVTSEIVGSSIPFSLGGIWFAAYAIDDGFASFSAGSDGQYLGIPAQPWERVYAHVARLTPVAFAALPASPSEGMMAWVNNSNTATWGATVAGGGANKVLVVFNGANWTVAGK